MPNIQLRTGNTIYISVYEYYFKLRDEDMDLFFQSCEADNLGIQIDNPFSDKRYSGMVEDEPTTTGDIPEDSIVEDPDWDI
jgi:hypothetical protein